MIPMQASAVSHQYWRKTPVRMRNSPAKELEPGMARDAIATIRKTPVRRGAPAARPPMSSMRSSGSARLMTATMAKAAATTMPWLTIWSTAPWEACTSMTMTPRRMKPRWARLE